MLHFTFHFLCFKHFDTLLSYCLSSLLLGILKNGFLFLIFNRLVNVISYCLFHYLFLLVQLIFAFGFYANAVDLNFLLCILSWSFRWFGAAAVAVAATRLLWWLLWWLFWRLFRFTGYLTDIMGLRHVLNLQWLIWSFVFVLFIHISIWSDLISFWGLFNYLAVAVVEFWQF